MQSFGGFVVSLDFELHWGVRDHLTIGQYRDNLLGVRKAIPAMLELFVRYGIHATWATVGFLFLQNRDELMDSLPEELPVYCDTRLDPYAALSELGWDEEEDPFHYAPSLIQKILTCEGQEIGTHTFSHYYPLAEGPTLESFRSDLESAKNVAHRYGITLKSIVFPRNQVSQLHLQVCSECGLIAYRGTGNDPWICKENDSYARFMRLADSCLYLGSSRCMTPYRDPIYTIVDVPQSRFLRPWSSAQRVLAPMQLKRILASMDAAAKNNRIFHLWWHPHNFGVHLEKNMTVLTHIANHYLYLHEKMRWPSLTMSEIAEIVLREERPSCVA
ncbi:MAG: polysaccharide deacetylase family protein [Acidobacteriaceae bacterium]|nr:polysaccharide deacetylase family protein [Acidobacteriaceae bacterium]